MELEFEIHEVRYLGHCYLGTVKCSGLYCVQSIFWSFCTSVRVELKGGIVLVTFMQVALIRCLSVHLSICIICISIGQSIGQISFFPCLGGHTEVLFGTRLWSMSRGQTMKGSGLLGEDIAGKKVGLEKCRICYYVSKNWITANKLSMTSMYSWTVTWWLSRVHTPVNGSI
jgi:hypothetical protein